MRVRAIFYNWSKLWIGKRTPLVLPYVIITHFPRRSLDNLHLVAAFTIAPVHMSGAFVLNIAMVPLATSSRHCGRLR